MISKEEVFTVVCENKWVIIGCTGLLAGYLTLKTNRRVASWVHSVTKTNLNGGFRQAFNGRFVFVASQDRDGSHSHPISARLRTDAERSIDNLIVSEGYEPYSVSTSARDGEGQRLVYSAKDLDLPYQNVVVTDRHIVRMIDVDYYADMEYWLKMGRPIIAYTFVPEVVGGPILEGVFSIDNNLVSVTYDGGATYEHQLWDYNVDHFIVKGWFKSTMVKVDQVRVPGDPNRRIICLTPTTRYWNIIEWMFPAKVLTKRKFTYGDANVSTYHKTSDGVTNCMVSVALRGTPSQASLKYATFVAICKRISLTKADNRNLSDVERYLRADNDNDAAIHAPLIYEAFEGGWYKTLSYRVSSKVVDAGQARTAPHFQAAGPLVTEDGAEIGVQTWKPVLTGTAIFPRQSYNNDVQSVTGRVENIRNTRNPKPIYKQYMREFVQALPTGVCVPVSMDEVITRQDKPLQKIRCQRNKAWCGCQKFHVKAFMKKEAYQKVTDPRNISTCTPSHTMKLSTYTYAAKEIFKRFRWFVPGSTPKEIAELVQDLVEGHSEVLSCDYSRLDGTISAFLREVERGCYLRLFNLKDKEELGKLLADEQNCRATTATGKPYEPGSSRLSGSPLTTDGNTIIVAFVAYCAFRKAKIIKKGELDRIMALVYGDDKLVVGVTKQQLETVASELGLTLKCNRIMSGSPVDFLSRVFVNPWITPTSIQEPVRALGKMHLSTVRTVDKQIVAHNKAKGYFVTDRLTPLIKNYCLHILTKTNSITEKHLARHELLLDTPYWSFYKENESWIQQPCDHQLMEEVVAKRLEISVADLRQLCSNVDSGNWEPLVRNLPDPTIEAVVTDHLGNTSLQIPERPSSPPDEAPMRPRRGRQSTASV